MIKTLFVGLLIYLGLVTANDARANPPIDIKTPNSGEWRIYKQVKFGEAKYVTADLMYGKYPEISSLTVSCAKGTQSHNLSVMIKWPQGTASKFIIVQADDHHPMTFYPSSDGSFDATYIPNPNSFLDAINFGKKLKGVTTNGKGNFMTVTFDITGIDNAIRPVLSACEWP